MRSTDWVRLLGFGFALAGCEGPSVPTTVQGEPMCANATLAGQSVKGGLRHPVRLTLKNGDAVAANVVLFGVPEGSRLKSRFLLPDIDADYSAEWALCANARALTTDDPRERKNASKNPDGTTYECGVSAPYATTTLSTRVDSPESHTLQFATGDGVECWKH